MAKFEGSAKDRAEDAKQAKKAGMSQKDWEKSPADKQHDAAGGRHATKKPPPRRKAPVEPLGLATPPGGDDAAFAQGGDDFGGM